MARKVDDDLYLEEGDEMKFEDHAEGDPLEEKRPRGAAKKAPRDDEEKEDASEPLFEAEEEEESF